MLITVLIGLACFLIGFLVSHRLVLVGLEEAEKRWLFSLQSSQRSNEKYSQDMAVAANAATAKAEKIEKEFEILSARFHHVERKIAGMTRVVKHEFSNAIPVSVAPPVKGTLLKKAGLTQ